MPQQFGRMVVWKKRTPVGRTLRAIFGCAEPKAEALGYFVVPLRGTGHPDKRPAKSAHQD
jgi:hypothetical protein